MHRNRRALAPTHRCLGLALLLGCTSTTQNGPPPVGLAGGWDSDDTSDTGTEDGEAPPIPSCALGLDPDGNCVCTGVTECTPTCEGSSCNVQCDGSSACGATCADAQTCALGCNDSAACALECASTQSCAPVCSGSASCALGCDDAEDCDILCEDSAVCDVHCDDAGACTQTCRDSARCTTACEGADVCALACSLSASCDVQCEDDQDCVLACDDSATCRCAGTGCEVTCGGRAAIRCPAPHEDVLVCSVADCDAS